MNLVGMIPDIPKVYTALAEWLACTLYIILYSRPDRRARNMGIAVAALAVLIILQIQIGKTDGVIWLMGMGVALVIMYFYLYFCGRFSKLTAGYVLARAFILAEFAAALEWQTYYFIAVTFSFYVTWFRILYLVLLYVLVYGVMFFLEYRQRERNDVDEHFEVSARNLTITALIAAGVFALSNLSYVTSYTPFSTDIATAAFNIRTMVDFGGVAILYAFHLQLCEYAVLEENAALQNTLSVQYAQYRESKENIDMINQKYHDLKHQIAVLRSEGDSEKRNQYLDEMEQGIKEYEAQNKTGNAVLDTVLTSKSTYCAKHDISMTCVADGSLLDNMHVTDICTIFGNALDNAIEYELQVEDKEKRMIHLSVSAMNEFTLICVENYYEGKLVLKDGLPETTKPDKQNHGFGIKSIRSTVQKYDGVVTISQDGEWFVLKILIPN